MSKYEPKTPSIWLMLVPFVFMGISGYFLQIKFSDFILLSPFLQIYTIIFSIGSILLYCYILGTAFYIKYIVNKLQREGKYKEAVITTMDSFTGRRRLQSYYYIICEDIETSEIYESDSIDLEEMVFSVGDSVHVYVSPIFPSLYWVDLNTIKKGKGKLSQDEINEGEDDIKTIKKEMSSIYPSFPKTKIRYILIFFSLIILVFLKSIFPSVLLYFTGVYSIGIVEKIDPYNDVCKYKVTKKSTYEFDDCTKYNTTLVIKNSTTNNSQPIMYFISPLSSARGLNQPITLSKYKIGNNVTFIIDKDSYFNNKLRLDSSEILLKDDFILRLYFPGIFIFCLLVLTLKIIISSKK